MKKLASIVVLLAAIYGYGEWCFQAGVKVGEEHLEDTALAAALLSNEASRELGCDHVAGIYQRAGWR